MQSGSWEPGTVQAVGQLRPGDLFVDIGAWIGGTALLAAARGATVLAFEPDPVARDEFERNIGVSGLGNRITVHPFALTNRDGRRLLTARDALGDSMSSLYRRPQADRSTSVEAVDVRSMLPQFEGARIVKIDIEGGEYALLPAMRPWLRKHRPDLMLSLHTYHLAPVLSPLPRGVRFVANRASAIALRGRVAWLPRIYPHRKNATAMGWEPISAARLARLAATPGQFELYLSA
jgi:FkbM family methyltransferase